MRKLFLFLVLFTPAISAFSQISPAYYLAWYEDFRCESFGAQIAEPNCSTDGPGAAGPGSWIALGAAQVEINQLSTTASSQLGVFETATFNVSSMDEVAFRTSFFTLFITSGSYVDIFYNKNNQGYTHITNYQGMGNSTHTLTNGFIDDNIDITDILNANTLKIRVEMFCNNCSSHDLRMNEIFIFGKDLCPEVLDVDDNPIADNSYQADTINSTGSIPNNGNIIFRAAECNLNEGFSVATGGVFETINDPCPN